MKALLSNRIVRGTVAAAFILVGVTGLVLPVLPGLPFLGFAAVLLFPDADLTRSAVAKTEQSFPSLGRLLGSLLEHAKKK